VTSLALAEVQGAEDLAVFTRRLASSDPDAVVRVVARGTRVGCFAGTPFDVLLMRAARLREPAQVDEVVEAGTLAARAASAHDGVVELPPSVPALRWAGPLPPSSGWAAVTTIGLWEGRELVADGIEEFRTRVASVAEADRSQAALESIAADVWEREVVPGLRVRLLHAAESYGFLGPRDWTDADIRIGVRSVGRWTRVDAPYGTVIAREGSALDLLVG